MNNVQAGTIYAKSLVTIRKAIIITSSSLSHSSIYIDRCLSVWTIPFMVASTNTFIMAFSVSDKNTNDFSRNCETLSSI